MNAEERKTFNRLWYRFKGKAIGLLVRCLESIPNFTFDIHCMCGSGMRPHFKGGDVSCEYWKHHCDNCHEEKYCTLKECRKAFK